MIIFLLCLWMVVGTVVVVVGDRIVKQRLRKAVDDYCKILEGEPDEL